MSKLSLPTVTLFCADCVNVERAVESIERCKSVVDFGAVKFMTNLPTDYPHIEIAQLKSLVHYSVWMLKESYKFVDTEHFLVCQHDAWIINPEAWNPAWLNYAYIAPLFTQCPVVGSGGFSLRQTELMRLTSAHMPHWDGTHEHAELIQPGIGAYEDGIVSMQMRPIAESHGMRYPSIYESMRFAQGGNPDPAYHSAKPFGFHREGRIGLTSPLLP